MKLRELEKRRLELLGECLKVDRVASMRRDRDEELTPMERAGFEAHVRLRIVEREIAKLKEVKR